MPLQRAEVTMDMVSTVPVKFWKDYLLSPLGGDGGINPLPCKPLHEGPRTASPVLGRELKGLRLLLKLSLLLSMLFLSPDPDATP